MRQWPEQTIRAMTLIMQLQGPQTSCLMRLDVKPWEMGHFRHRYTNGVETPDLINLRALTRLGAVKNEADLLAWSLKNDGVDGDPT
jgi:hypothetical protein